jgi:methylamine dehydrogenase accessory protein MauD
MTWFLLASALLLWGLVLFLGFLLLGALRGLAFLGWRLEQLQATTPRRLGRDGLQPGVRAPDFSLSNLDGAKVALSDFAGRKVLLAFLQTGCSPCHRVVPELNRLQAMGSLQVLVVTNSDLETTRQWARAVEARVPVLRQDTEDLARQYAVVASPFAFLVDEHGKIAAKGIIQNRQHVAFLLSGARAGAKVTVPQAETAQVEDSAALALSLARSVSGSPLAEGGRS